MHNRRRVTFSWQETLIPRQWNLIISLIYLIHWISLQYYDLGNLLSLGSSFWAHSPLWDCCCYPRKVMYAKIQNYNFFSFQRSWRLDFSIPKHDCVSAAFVRVASRNLALQFLSEGSHLPDTGYPKTVIEAYRCAQIINCGQGSCLGVRRVTFYSLNSGLAYI